MEQLVLVVALALSVAVAHGANARIARLVTEDEITAPIRQWAVTKWGQGNLVVRWMHCPWCFGWWSAWPVTAVAWLTVAGLHYWPMYFLTVWSVAHAAGRLNHNHGS